VLAILGGLGAAVAWATTTLCSARSSRLIGPPAVLSWVMAVGLVVTAPAAIARGIPAQLHVGGTVGWLVLAGVGNVAGLLLTYAGLRIGKVGIVAPIASTEGAIAAVLSVAAGEHLAASVAALLAVVAAGIVLTAVTRMEPEQVERESRRPVLLALAAALAFGSSLYATGRAGAELPVFWAVLPPRVVGVVAVTLPLAAASRLRLTRRALPLVLIGGLAEVAGFVSFTLGSRHGLAVSAVLASQFAAIAVIVAFLLFRERLLRVQVAGVALIVAGVAALTALQS
jgi:drug/metabolite transporter (DMT)-like permease